MAAPPSGCGNGVGVGHGFAAGCLDLVNYMLGSTLVAAAAIDGTTEVIDDNQCATAGEQQRVLPAEAAAGACDDDYLAVVTESV